jgi:hypothetical protein
VSPLEAEIHTDHQQQISCTRIPLRHRPLRALIWNEVS